MAKIDTYRDFTKYVGSLKKAKKFIHSLMGTDKTMRFTERRYGRRIDSVFGSSDTFDWSYNPVWKTVSVTYTDGRPAPVEKEQPEFYVVWIEGIEPRAGEKVQKMDSQDYTITTSMTQAMRVKPEHRDMVKTLLKEQGVADWCLNGTLFVRTNYAPKGTIFNPDNL
jgi:hypothetical protein